MKGVGKLNKKIIKLMTLFTASISSIFMGCSRITTIEETTAEITTPIETTAEEEFQECTDEEYEKARQDVGIIIQALNNQDSEQLKSVLTDVTLQKTPNLDKEIQYVFDMLDGEIVEVEEHDAYCDEIFLNGKKECVIYLFYNISTAETDCVLDLLYIPRTDEDIREAGVFSFLLTDYSREYEYFVAARPYYYLIPGVFSSDLATIEYNENKIATFYKEIGLEESQIVVKYELNRIGIEKITDFVLVETTDWGGADYVLTDSINNKYYIMVDETGFVYNVQENDTNGKVIYTEFN